MTNYNERLDEQLNYLMEYSYKYGRCEIPSSENPPLIIARQAKQAITSLMKELVAGAKPEITFSKPEGMPNTLAVDFAQRHLNQFEQNLLKALEQL